MAIAGEYVPEQFQNHLIGTITRHSDLHSYAVQKMYAALIADLSQDSLNQGIYSDKGSLYHVSLPSHVSLIQLVSAWCLGEYGDLLVHTTPTENGDVVTPNDIIQILEKILVRVGTSVSTKEYILTALFKLSVCFY
jgi:AP-1 complex subunit gamma-1